MKAAIVSTHKTWDSAGYAWAHYHLALGFSKLYVFVDGEQTGFEVKPPPSVELTYCGANYWKSLSPTQSYEDSHSAVQASIGTPGWGSPEALTYRQMLNVCSGLDCARADGVDWLLHIDNDEFFWCPDVSIDEHFESLTRDGIAHAHFLNHESIVRSAPAGRKESTIYFRKNWEMLSEHQRSMIPSLHPNKAYFLSYSGGKSAARVDATTGPNSAHFFKSTEPVSTSRPAILHIPYRSADQFCEKHMSLGAFADRMYGAPWMPQKLYADARELVRNGDREGLQALFESIVLVDEAEFVNLASNDFLLRLDLELDLERSSSSSVTADESGRVVSIVPQPSINSPASGDGDVTVVLTSCGRHDLLEETLSTFREFNTYTGIKEIIVVEDGTADPSAICAKFGARLIQVGRRIGQMHAIDLAYAQVNTPYIFHLEDDWSFYRYGFIEASKKILEVDPSTLQVWLRSWHDTMGHPLAFRAEDESFGVMATDYLAVWNGFSLNPSLKRVSDYKRLGSYASVPSTNLHFEAAISMKYRELGYRAVILDKRGFVKHIGWGRHIE